ncbi:MAG: metallophosphoesterase, partial [Desulfurococcaceae archaeon]
EDLAPDPGELEELCFRLKERLDEERRRVQVGGYSAHGVLARIGRIDRLVVVGDIHGDLESLEKVLSTADLTRGVPEGCLLVFLGDYVDRGEASLQVVYTVFKLKLENSGSTVLLRGNHEGPPQLPVYPHDFPTRLQKAYGDRWLNLYEAVTGCFSRLYACALLEGALFLVHGGVPTSRRGLDDLSKAEGPLLEELLWNDPMEECGCAPSPRGAGFLFGPDITDSFLKGIGAKAVIRSHEPCNEGYRVSQSGRVLTVFSRKGYPYFNSYGAYLDIRKPHHIEGANQLAEGYIKKF